MLVKLAEAEAPGSPTVAPVIGSMTGPDGRIMSLARDLSIALPDAADRTVYDGFRREWTPAYYLAIGLATLYQDIKRHQQDMIHDDS